MSIQCLDFFMGTDIANNRKLMIHIKRETTLKALFYFSFFVSFIYLFKCIMFTNGVKDNIIMLASYLLLITSRLTLNRVKKTK